MKKILKFFVAVIILIGIFSYLKNISYAAYHYDSALTVMDNKKGNEEIQTKTRSIAATIINVIQIVGTGVAIIMLTYIAIKYMLAAPTEKAEYKQTATGFIVGALILFSSTAILQIIKSFAEGNVK